TPNITVDNKVYLKESIMCWINTSSPGLASKPAIGWDVYGGQSYMGYYSRIAFAWPELTGLPENPDFVEIQVYHWSCQSSTLTNNRHVSIYDINATWEDSSIPSWDGRPAHDSGVSEKAYGCISCYTGNSTLSTWIPITSLKAYYDSWFNNPSFYGFAIYSNEAWNSGDLISIRGPGYADPSLRPILRITRGGNTVDFVFEELP
ncbi:unnamed protein product, partial [marine sediment metagenome]